MVDDKPAFSDEALRRTRRLIEGLCQDREWLHWYLDAADSESPGEPLSAIEVSDLLSPIILFMADRQMHLLSVLDQLDGELNGDIENTEAKPFDSGLRFSWDDWDGRDVSFSDLCQIKVNDAGVADQWLLSLCASYVLDKLGENSEIRYNLLLFIEQFQSHVAEPYLGPAPQPVFAHPGGVI